MHKHYSLLSLKRKSCTPVILLCKNNETLLHHEIVHSALLARPFGSFVILSSALPITIILPGVRCEFSISSIICIGSARFGSRRVDLI